MLRAARLSRGLATVGPVRFACAVGRAGRRASKREGDGATPAGRFGLVAVYWRPDRMRRPVAPCPVLPIRPDLGWCDDVRDRNYNRPVRLPYPASAERMWREDELYDLVVVVDHNRRPRVRGHGSAIFLHVAREGLAPTEGCVALPRCQLRRVLGMIGRGTQVVIE